MAFETLRWVGDIDGYPELIDQRLLPARLEMLKCETPRQLYGAIKTLAVRGAPAIGVAAAFGICLAMQKAKSNDLAKAVSCLEESADYLATARPTAVNLSWALDRMKECARKFIAENDKVSLTDLRRALLSEATAICDEDRQMCRRIGKNGQKLIKTGTGILTHCNAGALATAGRGTALSILYEAHDRDKKFKVYVDETRPLLQGARLTMWELTQAGIDATLICDNMAGTLMKQGKIKAVITGADRIAANGDTANKIGTFSLSILAKQHNIPFYVAAPQSTFDLSTETGDDIPIEQRDGDEVASFGGIKIAPEGADIYNPAFDVTDAENITAIITDKGVIENPNTEKIAELLVR
ncbi:MAG TPA: S-methyl-5-thioribose-1-phosphate isomerase [Planctomycetes bacterium]|nr:S-methyl-5-thioribose-1-phosphate isomerase [Planctomycetota bacterium]HIJ71233.1 S-methyl-5-thioribose-1-phosphate isomerase [Planctomycetota bacterium]